LENADTNETPLVVVLAADGNALTIFHAAGKIQLQLNQVSFSTDNLSISASAIDIDLELLSFSST